PEQGPVREVLFGGIGRSSAGPVRVAATCRHDLLTRSIGPPEGRIPERRPPPREDPMAGGGANSSGTAGGAARLPAERLPGFFQVGGEDAGVVPVLLERPVFLLVVRGEEPFVVVPRGGVIPGGRRRPCRGGQPEQVLRHHGEDLLGRGPGRGVVPRSRLE